jgi:glycerophosphoryl diester phosphodiesterase
MAGSHEFPENTIAGLTATIREGGAVGVEIDVMLTADREIVLMHDARLERTTRCTGCVSTRTLAEVAACRIESNTLDAGPASLADALSAVAELPVVPLLILDVKSDPWLEGCPPVAATRAEHERTLGRRIGEALRDAVAARDVAVQSKVVGVLDAVRERAPDALLFALGGSLDDAVDLAHGRYDGAAAWCDTFNESGRQRARASGLYLDTYIVNSPIDLAIAVAHDVDMVESDYVPELLAWFD